MKKKHPLKHKKSWIIGGSIALVALLATCAGYSALSWRSYEQNYSQWKQSTKSVLDRALALPVHSDKQRAYKLSALKQIEVDTAKRQVTICNTRPLSGWQTSVIDSFKHSQKECQLLAKKMGALLASLKDVNAYLDNERILSNTLHTAQLVPATTNERGWETSAAAWKAVERQVSAQKVSLPFQPTKDAARETVKAIDMAWQEVLAANGEKDKLRFIKAQAQLTVAYDRFNILKTKDDEAFAALLKAFDTAYSTSLN